MIRLLLSGTCRSAARALRRTLLAAVPAIAMAAPALATPFTMTTPNGIALPTAYPQAGGVAMVMVGVNGNVYYQFSDPTGAFVGYQNTGNPAAFRGNPFTINTPLTLNCGNTTCSTYFGGAIASMYIRFSASDGDTASGDFDFNDISLVMNGFTVGNWSSVATQITNTSGTSSSGTQTGFGNNTFNTGWFTTTNGALLSNILATGQTTTQVFDRDPNDNYWDFTIGNSLANPLLRNVAPGYDLTKTPSTTTYTAVGQTVTYTYVIRNIGSVRITNLGISDNKIASVTCNKTVILATNLGQTPDQATCTGTYAITQADIDAGSVTNIANGTGTPDFGVLGGLTATATVTGPAAAPALTLTKTSTATRFGNAGTTVPYTFTFRNTGNVTLTNLSVSDPKLPGLSCTAATLAPGAQQTCTANYTVTQADVDNWIFNSTRLNNTATVNGQTPSGANVSTTATRSLPGSEPAPVLTIAKTTSVPTFSSVGTVINYAIAVTNTGNVTFPSAPAISDPLVTGAGGAVTCPAGPVAPGASVTCTASYTVTQANLDAGSVVNTATATVTIGTKTATGTASVTSTATAAPALTLVKRLAATSPANFNATGTSLAYEYLLTNTGNVTLNAPAVTDNKTTVTCPGGSIAPGASAICTATYATTQADLDAGGVTNTATGRATPAGSTTPVTSAGTSLTVPAVQATTMTMVKTAPNVPSASFAPGLVVTYSYQVTNTGNVTLTQPVTVSDSRIGTPPGTPFACGSGTLAPGASRTCTATYTVTAADVAAGVVVNSASASSGGAISNTATATIPQSGAPALTLAKTANTGSFSALTDTLSYTFTVTNSGATTIVSLTPVTISDPKITNVTCTQPAILSPGGSFTCTGSYTPITQAEMDAGQVVNSATASFNYTGPGGGTTAITSPSSTATVPAAVTPSLMLAKAGPANFNAVGQAVTFTFTITNTGLQTLSTVTVTDPLIPSLSCTPTNIAPGGTANCSGSYTVTQSDMDAGQIANTATANATTPAGGTATAQGAATVPVAAGAATKSMTLAKTASPASFAAAGDTIGYTFAVANTGTQTLTGITVSDPLIPSFACTIASLAPGATDTSCTASYTVTQADVDRGTLTNTASASAAGAATVTGGATAAGPAANPALSLTKSANPASFSGTGQTITYTLAVANTGNVTLTNVIVDDPLLNGPNPGPTCTIGTLAPGASDSSCTATYSVTQADLDTGSITNTARADFTDPSGSTRSVVGSATIAGPAAAPAVQLTKVDATGTGVFGGVGTPASYSISVTNTGNVTLGGAIVSDPLTGLSCQTGPIAPGQTVVGGVCVGGGTLNTTYIVTQADVDAGVIVNTATVDAQTISGTPVSNTATLALTGPTRTPSISMVKTATSGANFTAPGQTIAYGYVITNTGNVTLTAPVSVSDNLIASVSCPALPPAGLAPGAALTCTASYRVTQADVDAGSVTNNATATLTQTLPGNPTPVVLTASDSETAAAAQAPAMSLSKAITAGTSSGYDSAGDTLSYTFLITNSGNTTITGPVQLDDPLFGAPFVCAAGPIAPGAAVSCQRTYTITQADVDAGSVTNTATAFTGPAGSPTLQSNPSSETAFATQTPSLGLTKSTSQTSASDFTLGNVITYTYVVTNTGNVTIAGPVGVTDNLLPVTCPTGALTPGASLTCTGAYTITANDIALGSLTNNAVPAATFGGNPVLGTPASLTIPAGTAPALTIAKTETTGQPISAVGQVLSYSYTVTNSGNASFASDVFVVDDKIPAPILCYDSSGGTAPFGQGAATTCTATYSVTQADLDAGFVTNSAFGRSVYAPASPSPTTVQSPSQSVTVAGALAPALSVAKSASGPNPASAGDVLTYTITATNIGNQTISAITVSDPLLPALACTIGGNPAPGNIALAPGQALVCTGTHAVTQAEIDAQSLVNTATVDGLTPQGAPVSTTASHTQPLVPAAPQLSVVKTILNPAPPALAYSQVNDLVTYGISVTNSGNITATNVSVTDNLVPGTCSIGTLAPGATDTSCQFVQQITQADIDAGSVVNTATASAQPANPGAPPISGQGSVTAQGPAAAPSFVMAKSANVTAISAAGQVVTYTYDIANTGNVTITTAPQVTDNKIGTFACGAPPILPGGFVQCGANYTVTQADINGGGVTNTASVAAPGVPASAPVSVTLPATNSPGLTLTKSVMSARQLFPTVWQTTFAIDAVNTGNLTLTALDLQDDLAAFVAPATLLSNQYPVTVSVSGLTGASANPSYDGVTNLSLLAPGSSMNPGEQGRVLVTLTYSTLTANPGGTNIVTATSPQLTSTVAAGAVASVTDTDGDGIPDTLESCSADRDGDGICDAQDYDPTGYFYCEDDGTILSGGGITVQGPAGSASGIGTTNGITIVQDGSNGGYTFFVSQPGRYTLIPTYPATAQPSASRVPISAPLDVTGLSGDPAVLGSGEAGSTGRLADFSAAANTPSFLVFDIDAGDPHVIGNNLAMTNCAGTSPVQATKTANKGTARKGESVNFTLTFFNGTGATFAGASLVDALPAGMIYTPGSGVLDGAATEPASVAGGRLIWTPVTVAPNQTITLTLAARVTNNAAFGTITNRAWLADAGGNVQSNVATANVRIEPEHVFDCSDVIGKVFDDANMNGYQDEGEEGIPGARVVTIRGVRITADDHGRFHVPCAELPADIGSNFTLKLDTRSLPTGYRVTTENPRTIRLTAGKMAKLNFGAAIANVVDVDLADAAFAGGKDRPSKALAEGIRGLVSRLQAEPSVVRLSYIDSGEPLDLIRKRMDRVEALLRDAWAERGRYKLTIERTIKRVN